MTQSPYYPSSQRSSVPVSHKTVPQPGNAFFRPSRPPEKHRNHLRESGIIMLILFFALIAILGGLLFARIVPLPAAWFVFGQPTPVSSLSTTDALQHIRAIYPHATLSLVRPLPDEEDLITTQSSRINNTTLTRIQVTTILELFIRSHPHQRFWRWVDRNTFGQQITTYEVYSNELWVMATDTSTCNTNWMIYTLTPQQIIAHGSAHQSYDSNAVARQGNGMPPTNPYNACSTTSG